TGSRSPSPPSPVTSSTTPSTTSTTWPGGSPPSGSTGAATGTATVGDLEVDTRVTPASDDGTRYAAKLSPDWAIWGPNGGYVPSGGLGARGPPHGGGGAGG